LPSNIDTAFSMTSQTVSSCTEELISYSGKTHGIVIIFKPAKRKNSSNRIRLLSRNQWAYSVLAVTKTKKLNR